MMFYEPAKRDRAALPHDPFKALIAPRPIGWVTTQSAAGAVNLAPYSFFNGFTSSPHLIGFSSEGLKDSVTFAQETREFVWNMATFPLRDAMNATSASLPRGDNEFVHAGLAMAPSNLVKPPRVTDSPAAFECKVTQIINLSNAVGEATAAYLVVGEVIGVHIDEKFIKNGMVDTAAMQPIARCGYHDYAVVDRVFSLKRPG